MTKSIPTLGLFTSRRMIAGVLLAFVTFAAAGCGASTIDPDSITKQIVKAQQELVPDLKVDGAKCPADIEATKGATFECTVNVDGVKAPYDVTVTKIEGDDVVFDFEPAKAIISVAETVKFAEDTAAKSDMVGAEVDCGDAAIIVQDAGTTFPCTLTLGDEQQDFEIEIVDTKGTIKIKE
ncbi:plastocyanin [Aeromicrobium panaciterrae]|uniref:Plastocyanin n=1 Tax=Aeromicrobium panaciterrae TaxID=363861 RepID=A0ABU1URS8_9ACTN|nr:DUF4333 domain-containing protein [Aeromicrobium panaciterrae]MDR7087903.1 plastocyanin [Aeromicrobium panaciterrae]